VTTFIRVVPIFHMVYIELMNNKKAVAYIRISSQKQVNNESPTTQRDAIQRYADANNIEIVEWFGDIAKSGKNADRDGLQTLLKYCLKHKGEIDYWIVYNMKRASRDIDTYSSEVRLVLKARGVSVRSATEPAVNDTKEGRFMENLLVLLGQLDNEGKAEVTIDNMRSLAFQGYWQHPPVVGYVVCKIPNDSGKPRPSLKPSLMAPKVTQVLERFSRGDITKAELTRYSAKIGLRSRYDKKLSEDSMNRLLKNPVYAGYVSDKFTDYELVAGKHDALISQATYERNQAILYPKNSRLNETHLQKNKNYPLKGLVLCVNCEQPLYASAPKTGSGTHSPRYHCARKQCRGKVKSIKAVTVHQDFEGLLTRIKPAEGILRLYKRVLISEAGNELGKLNRRLSAIRDELCEMDTLRLNTLRKFAEEVISLSEKNELIDALDTEKTERSIELRKLEEQQSIRESDIELAINIMDNVDKQWGESALDVQIRFQSMIFPKGLVYDSMNHRFGTDNISTLYRCIPNENAPEEALESYLVAGPGLEPGTSWL
jgi:site-specific DNA recombinase